MPTGDPNLGQAVGQYDAATGANVNASAPWNTPGWNSGSGQDSDAAFNQWFQSTYGYVPDYGPSANASSIPINAQTGMASATPNAATTNAAAPPQTITPATIQGQFPGGIPQATASGVGGIPAISAQQVMGSNVNPTSIDPNMSIAATEAYLQPQFQQQQSALTANLANAGIVGGTAPQAAAQLGQQQQTTLQNDIQPFLQAGALANQSTNLAGQQSNQNNAFNVGVANQGANLSAQNANQNAALQGGEFNSTAQNQAQQFNIQNLLQTGQIDAATANNMMQFIMGTQNQDWLAQLGAQTSTTTNSQNNQTAAYQPVYQQPATSSGTGALTSAFNVPQPQQPTIGQSITNGSSATTQPYEQNSTSTWA